MENKKRNILAAAGGIALLVLIAGVVIWSLNRGKQPPDSVVKEEQKSPELQQGEEEYVMTAMYVPIAGNVYILVDQENGTVFTADFPEEMYDITGNKITQEQLQKGNILKIYGNGIMLESYPGQYPGVSRMEVTEEGAPSDADVYQELVDGIYQAPDPSQPPELNAEYTTELAVVMAAIDRGGYQWTYMDEDGLSNAVVADGVGVLQWKEIGELKLDAPTDVKLHFSEAPESVTAVRWSADLINTEEEIPEGEAVKVTEEQGGFTIPAAEGGYAYEINATWENGNAFYGFMTVSS